MNTKEKDRICTTLISQKCQVEDPFQIPLESPPITEARLQTLYQGTAESSEYRKAYRILQHPSCGTERLHSRISCSLDITQALPTCGKLSRYVGFTINRISPVRQITTKSINLLLFLSKMTEAIIDRILLRKLLHINYLPKSIIFFIRNFQLPTLSGPSYKHVPRSCITEMGQ